MGSNRDVAHVSREKLSVGLTCPLCRNLFRDATTITECLHTFCRECIMKEINDEDADYCCPVCNVDLGSEPEEKLRPDHILQSIRNNIFPINEEKVGSSKGSTTVLPAKIKEKSLSSLVIDTSRALVIDTSRAEVKAGMTGSRTKATRSIAATQTTSPDKKGTVNLSDIPESQDQTTEKHTIPQSTKVIRTAKKNQLQNSDADAPPKKPSSKDNGNTSHKEEQCVACRTGSTRSVPKYRVVKEEVIKNEKGKLPISHAENEAARGAAATHPVWFSLVALPNQNEDQKLPQLSKNYLRVKDGSMKVSTVQRYITTKLGLANEEEVEIICRGESISPASTLQGLVDLCVRKEKGELIPASLGAPAEEFVMVLYYRRHRRSTRRRRQLTLG